MIKLILISLIAKGSDIRDLFDTVQIDMDKEKLNIIQALYNTEKDGLRKKLIGILLAEQKQQLNMGKAIG